MFVAPTLLGRVLGTDATTVRRTAWLSRMFAVRDLALGVGVLVAEHRRGGLWGRLSGRGSAELQTLLLLGAMSDLGDAVAMAGAMRDGSVRRLPATATAVSAVGAAVTGVVLAVR